MDALWPIIESLLLVVAVIVIAIVWLWKAKSTELVVLALTMLGGAALLLAAGFNMSMAGDVGRGSSFGSAEDWGPLLMGFSAVIFIAAVGVIVLAIKRRRRD